MPTKELSDLSMYKVYTEQSSFCLGCYAKSYKLKKNRDNFGSWRVCPLTRKKIGKSSKNSPILVLIFWGSIPCVWTLLKVVNVSLYDFSVLSMSVTSFQK